MRGADGQQPCVAPERREVPRCQQGARGRGGLRDPSWAFALLRVLAMGRQTRTLRTMRGLKGHVAGCATKYAFAGCADDNNAKRGASLQGKG